MTPEESERLARFDAVAAGALVVAAPTPDEDGVYRPIAQADVSTRRRVVVLDLGRPFHLRPDKAEALGAALLAAAQDARRLASSDVAKPRKPEETPDV